MCKASAPFCFTTVRPLTRSAHFYRCCEYQFGEATSARVIAAQYAVNKSLDRRIPRMPDQLSPERALCFQGSTWRIETIASFLLPLKTAGGWHFSRRRLLSMTDFGSPLPCGHGPPKIL